MKPEPKVAIVTGAGAVIGRATREEIANAALYVFSDEADFVAGAAFSIDGGFSL